MASAPAVNLSSLKLRLGPVPEYPFVDTPFVIDVYLVDDTNQRIKGVEVPLRVGTLFEGELTQNPCPVDLVSFSTESCIIDKNGAGQLTVTFAKCTSDVPGKRRVALVFSATSTTHLVINAVATSFLTCVRYRLEIDFASSNMPGVWYKDRGGNRNCMEARTHLLDATGQVVKTRFVPLKATLIYESGERVADQGILELKRESKLAIDTITGEAIVRFRINQVSSTHGRKMFRILIHPDPDDSRNADISPVQTAAVDVRSKVNKKRPKGAKGSSGGISGEDDDDDDNDDDEEDEDDDDEGGEEGGLVGGILVGGQPPLKKAKKNPLLQMPSTVQPIIKKNKKDKKDGILPGVLGGPHHPGRSILSAPPQQPAAAAGGGASASSVTTLVQWAQGVLRLTDHAACFNRKEKSAEEILTILITAINAHRTTIIQITNYLGSMYAAPVSAQNAAPSMHIPMPPSLLSTPQYNPYMHQQSGPYGHPLSSMDSYASQLHSSHNGMIGATTASSSFLQQIPGSALSFLGGGPSIKKKDKKHKKDQHAILSTRPVVPSQDDCSGGITSTSPGKSSPSEAASSLLTALGTGTGSWPLGGASATSSGLLSRQQSTGMGSTTMTTSSTDSIGDDNHDAAANHEQNLQAAVLNGGGLFSFPTGYLNGRGAPSWVLSDAEHQQQHGKKKKHHHLQQEEHSNNDHEREADKTTGMADILVSLRQSITDVNGDAGAVTSNKPHPHHPHSPEDSNDIDDEDSSSGAMNNTPKGGILLNGVPPPPGGVGKSSSNAEKKVDRILVKPASEHDAGGTDEMLAFDRKNMPVGLYRVHGDHLEFNPKKFDDEIGINSQLAIFARKGIKDQEMVRMNDCQNSLEEMKKKAYSNFTKMLTSKEH